MGTARTPRPVAPLGVAREECSEDARGSMVRLTDAGSAAVEDAAPEHSEAIRRYFFNPLSSDELETLAVVFDRLLDNIAREGMIER
jgi:DNA-binding MarR family transcriptional regulator